MSSNYFPIKTTRTSQCSQVNIHTLHITQVTHWQHGITLSSTLCLKKSHLILGHNFSKCGQIFMRLCTYLLQDFSISP